MTSGFAGQGWLGQSQGVPLSTAWFRGLLDQLLDHPCPESSGYGGVVSGMAATIATC